MKTRRRGLSIVVVIRFDRTDARIVRSWPVYCSLGHVIQAATRIATILVECNNSCLDRLTINLEEWKKRLLIWNFSLFPHPLSPSPVPTVYMTYPLTPCDQASNETRYLLSNRTIKSPRD